MTTKSGNWFALGDTVKLIQERDEQAWKTAFETEPASPQRRRAHKEIKALHSFRQKVIRLDITVEAIRKAGGKIKRAYRALGISRYGLYARLDIWGLEPNDARDPKLIGKELLLKCKSLHPLVKTLYGQ